MSFMKPHSIWTIILTLFALSSVFGQTKTLSKHQLSFYINEKEKSAANAEISIVVSDDTIKSNKIEGFHYFPVIDTFKQFNIVIRIKNILFTGQGYSGWMLNKGTTMTFGKLTKLNKLTSVANYNNMTEKDEGWEWYSKRFFIINSAHTIDIDNIDRIRELQFLIIVPNSSGKLINTQKTIR